MFYVFVFLVFLLSCAQKTTPSIPEKVIEERLSEVVVGMWKEGGKYEKENHQ